MEDVLDDLLDDHSDDEAKRLEPFGCVRVRFEKSVPSKFANGLSPKNDAEQKERFLKRQITPEFKLTSSVNHIEHALLSQNGRINFNLFREAKRILDTVLKQFKTIDAFVEASYGPTISVEAATEKVINYIKSANFPTPIEVIWCDELIGSALMASTRPDNPQQACARRFTVLMKSNSGNTYLRERGICCLMDHELGTHYLRSYNEGLQQWYMRRKDLGLSQISSCEMITTEEGLACLHTAFHGQFPYLGIPALLYYGACMAEYLPFKDLYHHLSKYVKNEEQLWKHCMRIKRCLASQNDCGGYGKDQRYFEGAVTVLREQANINFYHLMSGKLSIDDLDRSRESYDTTNIRLPYFMEPMEEYRARMREMARLNGIAIAPVRKPAAPANPLLSTTAAQLSVGDCALSDLASGLKVGGAEAAPQESPAAAHKYKPKKKRSTSKSPMTDYIQELKAASNKKTSCRNAKAKSNSGQNNRLTCGQLEGVVKDTPTKRRNGASEIVGPSDTYAFLRRFNFLEGLDFIDMTPVSIIREPTFEELQNEKREDSDEEGGKFASLVAEGCSCTLFTRGFISSLLGEFALGKELPILIEIDMRHPVLDAHQ